MPGDTRCFYHETPVGTLGIVHTGTAVREIRFCGEVSAPIRAGTAFEKGIAEELNEYFAGTRQSFSVPAEPLGTPFQTRVWTALVKIPYGETRCYGEIAAQLGNARASRAVGRANNRNPLPILVPCHRVIGKNGALTGYAGGLDIKAYLLELETRTLEKKKRERGG